MATRLSICNAALVKVGEARITALTETSKAAATLNAIYDGKRDAELAAAAWSFAITRVNLPATTTAPVFGRAYAYPLPADNLRVVQVGTDYTWYDPTAGGIFEYEGGSILTDQGSPLSVRYVRRVTNEGLFPALFAESFACRLAAEVTETLTQDAGKRDRAWDEWKQAIRAARRSNAIEQPPREVPPGSWLSSLLGL
jgi:hypothetical protein